MRVLTAVAGLAFIAAIGSVAFSQKGVQSQTNVPPPYRIKGIQAKLYYAQDGTLSENFVDNGKFALWNVVIGKGSATAPSYSTMVLVELEGPSRARVEGRTVTLTVTEQTAQHKLKQTNTVPIKRLGPTGRYFAAFWIDNTGCIPLQLIARITGQPATPPVEKALPFECGE